MSGVATHGEYSNYNADSSHYDGTRHHQQTNTLGTVFFYIGVGFFAVFAVAFFISAIVAQTNKQRRFSATAVTIVSIAATAYLAMAMGTGYRIRRDGRQVYWARYIDWFFTTPLLLYDLGSFSGVGLSQILIAVVFDVLMVLTGLFAALSDERSRRWVWFGMGCLAFIPVLYLILINFRKYRVPEVKRPYTIQSIFLVTVWLIYPIAWALGTGSNTISNDAETVWVTILDIIAKCIYGSVWLFFFRDYLPYADGEIADRIAQAPRHPNTLAPPPGVAQPIDPNRPYHQVNEVPLATMPAGGAGIITGPAPVTEMAQPAARNTPKMRGGPNLVRRSGTIERGDN